MSHGLNTVPQLQDRRNWLDQAQAADRPLPQRAMHAQDWESSHPDDQYEKPKYERSSWTCSPLHDHYILSRHTKFYSVVIVPLCTWWVAARRLSTNMKIPKNCHYRMEESVSGQKFDDNVKAPHSLTLRVFPCHHCNPSEKILAGHRCAALTAAAPSISAGMLRIAGSHKCWMALSICVILTLLLLLIFKTVLQEQPHRWAVQPPSTENSIYHHHSSYTSPLQSYRTFDNRIDTRH